MYYEVIEDDEQESFFPEMKYDVTFADYMDKKDACVEYALAFKE